MAAAAWEMSGLLIERVATGFVSEPEALREAERRPEREGGSLAALEALARSRLVRARLMASGRLAGTGPVGPAGGLYVA